MSNKFCVNCKFYAASAVRESYPGQYAHCTRNDKVVPSLVTGEPFLHVDDSCFCETQRKFSNDGCCAPEGRFWQPIDEVIPVDESLAIAQENDREREREIAAEQAELRG